MKLADARGGRPDYILLFVLMALLSVGFIMVFSASPTLGLKLGDSFYYLRRHFLYLLIGFAAMAVGLRVDYHYLKKWSTPAMFGAILLLFALYIPGLGRTIGGAVRWLDLTIISFQPSELAKIVVILFLASLFSSWHGERGTMPKVLLVALAPVLLVAFLVLKQPDLGTTLVIIGTTFFMLFIAGVGHKLLLSIAFGGAGLTALLIFNSAYRLRRISAFFDPWRAPFDVGFHIIQSLLAIGSGGIFGLGLGASKQKFFYLPQHYTDFIFSILSEELGFLGAFGVVFLFVLFVIRGIRIARFAKDDFGVLLAGGIVSWIALQAVINLYVVTGLFPTTGIPLPFISFGGTALVVTLYSAGVLLNISKTLRFQEGSSGA
jgi:cell division protein FtsW